MADLYSSGDVYSLNGDRKEVHSILRVKLHLICLIQAQIPLK